MWWSHLTHVLQAPLTSDSSPKGLLAILALSLPLGLLYILGLVAPPLWVRYGDSQEKRKVTFLLLILWMRELRPRELRSLT